MTATELQAELLRACHRDIAALRMIVALAPIGGEGDKVAPPTHKEGQYAFETRTLNGGPSVSTVLLDSVQSQANRCEEALLTSIRLGEVLLPLLEIRIPQHETLTTLSVPHRIYDAIFRDSRYEGKRFRDSPLGQEIIAARPWNATALYRFCPTALLFGSWDSQGGTGVMGARFARALVSEIIGLDAVRGVRTSSRIDPLGIRALEGMVYRSATEQWTLDKSAAQKEKEKPLFYKTKGSPAEINHGNIPPTITDPETGPGGVTFREARQTAVLSFAQLRKLYFPLDGTSDPEVDVAGRAVLAALGIYALTLQLRDGYQLRSRCQLIPVTTPSFEWLGATADERQVTSLSAETARETLESLVDHASRRGLTWPTEPIQVEPEAKLIKLVQMSDAAEGAGE